MRTIDEVIILNKQIKENEVIPKDLFIRLKEYVENNHKVSEKFRRRIAKRYSGFRELKEDILNNRSTSPVLDFKMLAKSKNQNIKQLNGDLKEIYSLADKYDIYNSKIACDFQKEIGLWGERKIHKLLESKLIKFHTENEIMSDITPDFYFPNPIRLGEYEIFWIESKATTTDIRQVKRMARKQGRKYLERLGEGYIVMHFQGKAEIHIDGIRFISFRRLIELLAEV